MFLERLGLNRRELRAWAMYDWANSVFITTAATILPIYYAEVAAKNLEPHIRTAYWGYTAGFSLLLVALLCPLLGVMADYFGAKKKFLFFFLILGVAGSACLYFIGEGDWALASLFCVIATIGFAAGNVFYEALLPDIAAPEEYDRVSVAGFALGYIGGGILLVVNLLWITFPAWFGIAGKDEAVRLSFVSVAIWWALFSIPLFRHVREASVEHLPRAKGNIIFLSFGKLLATFREIKSYKQVAIFLCAYWLYMDGIGTIIKMATIYGKEIGIGTTDLIGSLVLVQFVGLPCTFAFGEVARRIGAKNGVQLCLLVYLGISILGFYMEHAWQFWALAGLVGLVQGGAQALSRSMFATMIPKQKSAEFFSFFSVSSRFAGVIGPLIFGSMSHSLGNSRYSILFLISFFVGGMLLLALVDVDKGKRALTSGM